MNCATERTAAQLLPLLLTSMVWFTFPLGDISATSVTPRNVRTAPRSTAHHRTAKPPAFQSVQRLPSLAKGGVELATYDELANALPDGAMLVQPPGASARPSPQVSEQRPA